jgi:hypothetical protein
LIELKVPLEDYFETSMNFFDINWETFPGLHSDSRTLIVPYNKESLRDLYYGYDELFHG